MSVWKQVTYITDAECASKVQDYEDTLYRITVHRDEATLAEARKNTDSPVHAVLEISVSERFTNDIVTSFLRDLVTNHIFQAMGINPSQIQKG